MRELLAVAVFAAALAFGCGASLAQTPSPAPGNAQPVAPSAKPSRSQAERDAASRIHRALVVCDSAAFYSWPARDSAPAPASYPPARMGDGFDLIGDAHVSYDGRILYETTIDVVHPWGDGTHYWIAARCVNAV